MLYLKRLGRNARYVLGKVQEWEAVFGEERGWEFRVQLWIAGLLKPLAPRGFRRAFHKIPSLCTSVFRLPVGVVGNRGRLGLLSEGFPNALNYTAWI
jgi:hypothetical protein